MKLEYKQLYGLSQIINALKVYDRKKTRLDYFWADTISVSEKTYERSTEFIKMTLILSHGNAALERGLSINE